MQSDANVERGTRDRQSRKNATLTRMHQRPRDRSPEAVFVTPNSQSPERRWDYLSLKVSEVELPSTREPSIGALGQSGGRCVARIVATIRELE